ncbi:MAG TPA: glycoside hydrolase family 2 TIM barrel-domain containing protein, partial [Polyangiaceae bacterium]|nr:glycoside hydrolase family 2 TIM barrel-domain containing protein [Polyangiaceae bacterium]
SQLEEMLLMSRNHACVVLWGILNESASDDEACRPAYAQLLGRLRELDPSRPVTYASNHPKNDLCFDLADVISVNCYPGWYWGSLAEIPAALDELLTELERKQPNKPIIISEIGAAGLYGWHDWHHGRWSEDYQAELLEHALSHLFASGRVAGVAIWQFCDIRTSDALPIILSRPRGFNNKGLVDEYRRPKAAFSAVRRLYQKLAAEGR